MQRWDQAEAKRQLLPPGRAGLTLVLFIEEGAPESAHALERFERASAQLDATCAIVAVGQCPEITRWFGLMRWPALAIVSQGALLTLEDDCSSSGCERALTIAREQLGWLNTC